MSKQVRLTLPNDLYNSLKEQAAADDRTVANYIVHLLKQKNINTNTNPAPIYFPPGVRSPIAPASIPSHIPTMPTLENPDGRPIVTCDTTHKK